MENLTRLRKHFIKRSVVHCQTMFDKNGTTRVYDPETNSFGSYNKDGSTKTFYKPKAGQEYFDRQPGK